MLLENQISGHINHESSNASDKQWNINENSNVINTINALKNTPIQDFYAGQKVFITGATGSLGKTTVEKLLRACPEVSTIYLLIRPKKQSDISERIENIFNQPIFDQLRKKQPKFRHKIVGIAGDCSLPDLGLSIKDRKVLTEEVNIVFHSAATLNFNEKLRVSTAINSGGTLAIVNLCKEIKKLKVMIYVSTAYANCTVEDIHEKFYHHPYKYEQLKTIVDSLPDDVTAAILPKILDKWPNTYTFTKALAEGVIKENCQDIPVGIFRPAIIVSCAEEPLPGWIDSFYGPTVVAAACTSGMMKYICVDEAVRANVVPVDYTVNALLACGWDVAKQSEKYKSTDDMMIYNYVSTVENPILWQDYLNYCLEHGRNYPIQQSVWYLTVHYGKNKIVKFFAFIFLHLLPAIILDGIQLICTGQKPKLLTAIRKMHKFINVIEPFTTRDWNFTNDNVRKMWLRLHPEDQVNFKFTYNDFNWKRYLRIHMIGVKLYFFKENLSDLEFAKKRLMKLRYIHETVKVLLFLLVLTFFWKIFNIFF